MPTKTKQQDSIWETYLTIYQVAMRWHDPVFSTPTDLTILITWAAAGISTSKVLLLYDH